MPSKVDICNRALSVIGTRSTIASIDEATPEAQACLIHFEASCRAMLRLAPWSFARYQVNGAVIAAATGTPENPNGNPPFPIDQTWSYEYAWPNDCLKLRQVLPPFNPPAIGPINLWPCLVMSPSDTSCDRARLYNYQITLDRDSQGNQIKAILTNVENAVIVYTALVDNPNLWDDEFSEAFVFMLASHLVGALIGDKQMDKALYQKASMMAIAARAVDANEQPLSPNHTPDWIKVRGYFPVSGDLTYPVDDDQSGIRS